MRLLISGYGAAPDVSVALYHDGKPVWTDGVEAPSFIVGGDGYLFAVTENETFAAVHAYRECAQGYAHTDSCRLEGGLLCHLSYSAAWRRLLGACYETGNVFDVPFDPESGCFGKVHSLLQTGESKSRAHSVLLHSAQNTVYSANIALDRIYCYRLNENGLCEEGFFSVPKGSGPRHLCFSENEQLLYVITEYSNEILVYSLPDGECRQRVSTLPDGFAGRSNCSTLCFSKDCRFLYAANRFSDTIAVFEVQENGLLGVKSLFGCGGNNPRHMALSPDGSVLAVCCQDSDEVVFHTLDRQSGLPVKEDEKRIPFLMPAGILWLQDQ